MGVEEGGRGWKRVEGGFVCYMRGRIGVRGGES